MTGAEVAALGAAVFLTATLSSIVGMAGGMTLLAVMLQWLDPLIVLPLHGAIQLVSNGSRTLIQREHVDWSVVWRFALPLLPAGVLGLAVAQALPRGLLRAAIGVLVVGMTLQLWRKARAKPPQSVPEPLSEPEPVPVPEPALVSASSPLPAGLTSSRSAGSRSVLADLSRPAPSAALNSDPPTLRFLLLGGAAGALNTSVGATGPVIAPFFLDLGLDRRGVIGTKAGCQSLGHLTKLVVFGAAGFAFAPYLPALALFAVAAVAGTWFGSRVLDRVSERWFTRLYLGVLLLLGLRLVGAELFR